MKKTIKLLILLFIAGLTHNTFAQVQDSVYSQKMQKFVPLTYVIPSDYARQSKAYPVLYLLHGYSGDYTHWAQIADLQHLSDLYQMILICPDGDFDSWYLDSPGRENSYYETFVAKELVKWTDEQFRTIADRSGRAITGLSMGGHGGMYLGLRHQQTYGACGSTSGAVYLTPIEGYALEEHLGSVEENKELWDRNSVVHLIDSNRIGDMAIIVDCGTDDFLLEANNYLHERLIDHKVSHDYHLRPGKHDRNYWNTSIEYQMLFFHRFFEKK